MPRSIAIIQARLGSSRLPGKVLAELAGHPMLAHVVGRAEGIDADEIIVATSTGRGDQAIADLCCDRGWQCFRGSEDDVLDRFYQTAREFSADVVLRLTADNPLMCPHEAARVLQHHLRAEADYTRSVGLPLGAGIEIASFAALERAWREAKTPPEREHVMPYLYCSGRFKIAEVAAPEELNHPELRLTVDEPEDLELMRRVYAELYRAGEFLELRNVVNFLNSNPQIAQINRYVRQRTL
jgi:spore coat polysaccharide biosynthesis protein SpsF (cytidylyltransferase family)